MSMPSNAWRAATNTSILKLSAISGVNGVYSDDDIAKVVKLAKEARKHWKDPGKLAASKGKAATGSAAGAKPATAAKSRSSVAKVAADEAAADTVAKPHDQGQV